jgi:hypothetical protein
MLPSNVAPAAIVLTAARAVVPDDFGKLVCRFVLVAAAEARAAVARRARSWGDILMAA